MLEDNTVFAIEGDTCYWTTQLPGPKQLLNIGRTTIFFASLVDQLLFRKNIGFGHACAIAGDCAFKWAEGQSAAWSKGEMQLFGDYGDALQTVEKPGTDKDTTARGIRSGDYQTLWKDWNDSSSDCGIVKRVKEIQLWRGEGTLPGYICVGGPKRNDINELVSAIAVYARQHSPQYPLSCLIVAAPGWGKSYLARCIAKYFDMQFLEFSVAQMANSSEVIQCLSTIASVQTRTKSKTLVFIDEFNSQVGGSPVTNLFLGPLWEGSFVLDGKTFKLEPGLWIFASTDPVKALSGVDSLKGSDFISRLNGPIVELESDSSVVSTILRIREFWYSKLEDAKQEKEESLFVDRIKAMYEEDNIYSIFRGSQSIIKTEQIYLIISLLNAQYGPIGKIDESVLQLFHDLLPINGFRSLEIFTAYFEGIRKGEVRVENVPQFHELPALLRHVVPPKGWWDGPRKAGAMIDIEKLME